MLLFTIIDENLLEKYRNNLFNHKVIQFEKNIEKMKREYSAKPLSNSGNQAVEIKNLAELIYRETIIDYYKLIKNLHEKNHFKIYTKSYVNLIVKQCEKFYTEFYEKIESNMLSKIKALNLPHRFYVGDITYIHTSEGRLYLAIVIDLFSRKVVGWAMDETMEVKLVNNALLMALWKRKPKHGLVWHTDRGSQYASDSHRKILQMHGIIQSMSRKGNCWNNAVSESFFHALKTELINHVKFKTKEEAKQAIFEYIEVFYNKKRFHSANDYLSPEEFELAHNFN